MYVVDFMQYWKYKLFWRVSFEGQVSSSHSFFFFFCGILFSESSLSIPLFFSQSLLEELSLPLPFLLVSLPSFFPFFLPSFHSSIFELTSYHACTYWASTAYYVCCCSVLCFTPRSLSHLPAIWTHTDLWPSASGICWCDPYIQQH